MSGLSPQESFRMGFLLRCAEEGCNTEEIKERVKYAAGGLGATLKALFANWAKLPAHAAIGGLGTALVAGPAIGYGAAKLQGSNVDPEEVNQQELINAYKLQTAMAQQRAKQREYRQSAPPAPKLFGP